MPSEPAGSDYAAWRDRLANANDPEFWPIEAIDALLARNEAQFWCDGESALVTTIRDYPGGARAIEAIAAAGNMASLVGQIAGEVERQAKQAGLTHMMVTGRPGWTRVFKDWRHYQAVLLKDLR